jgi:antitoxin (DNA-binding transcriptional repressor) of toxin-antitoxin stability system
MKMVKASEARRHWFRLLDEALQGEVIAVERKGQRIVLRREGLSDTKKAKGSAQYKKLLRVPQADEADRWSWEWRPERGLVSRRRPAR